MDSSLNEPDLVGVALLFKSNLGTLLRRQRHRRGLTQAQVAEAAGLSLKYFGEIERGEGNATVQALASVAAALGWNPWSLFSDQSPPMSQAVHSLLVSELRATRERVDVLLAWVSAMEPRARAGLMAEAVSRSDEVPVESGAEGPRRGRPRVRRPG